MSQQKISPKYCSILLRFLIVFFFGLMALSPDITPARAGNPPANHIYLPSIMRQIPPSWLDHIIFSAVSDYGTAISQLQAGTINMSLIPGYISLPPGLKAKSLYGSNDQILFNTVQCSDTNLLNPFNDMKIREAMNWAIDRNYIAQTIFSGLAWPKFTALDDASHDYKLYSAIIGPLEGYYAYNFDKAQTVVNTEMPLLGAIKNTTSGKWQYKGNNVVIIGLIRTEDARKQLGEYFASQLEALGFTVDRQEKPRSQAAPIWQGNPYSCLFNFYTAGWVSSITRDEGMNFAEFNSGQLINIPVFIAYQPSSPLATAENALLNNNFTSLAQREALFQTALTLSMQESWWGVWAADLISFEPYQGTLSVASDPSGIGTTPMWPYTLHFMNEQGGTVKIGQSSILDAAWNPIGGSNWIDDQTIILGTMDRGLIPDPNTGLNLPKLVQSASVVAKAGLPIFNSSSWVTFSTQASIPVPPDAWADWDASSQTFITAQQRHANDPNYQLTANVKTTVTYVPNLWDTEWHDGSHLSVGDFVMAMIMQFDPGKPASKIYDPGYVSIFQSFMSHFKGVRIISTNPLVIETYDDAYQLDAENTLTTWYPAEPTYAYGTGAWHNLAPAIQAEAEGKLTFFGDKVSNSQPMTNMIAGPTLAIQASYLNTLASSNTIPYAPTLSSYITPAEIATRYANLMAWYQARGNLWIGTGPYYIDQVNINAGTISLAPFSGYVFPPGQYWKYAQ